MEITTVPVGSLGYNKLGPPESDVGWTLAKLCPDSEQITGAISIRAWMGLPG